MISERIQQLQIDTVQDVDALTYLTEFGSIQKTELEGVTLYRGTHPTKGEMIVVQPVAGDNAVVYPAANAVDIC